MYRNEATETLLLMLFLHSRFFCTLLKNFFLLTALYTGQAAHTTFTWGGYHTLLLFDRCLLPYNKIQTGLPFCYLLTQVVIPQDNMI